MEMKDAFAFTIEEEEQALQLINAYMAKIRHIKSGKEQPPDIQKQLGALRDKFSFLSKELANTKKENKVLKEKIDKVEQIFKKKIIKFEEIEHVIHIPNLHNSSNVTAILELESKQIVTGSGYSEYSLSLCSIDYENATFKQECILPNAHSSYIMSLIELEPNVIASCSYDGCIKIWKITNSEFVLETTIQKHTSGVYKLITLSNNKFASCSRDGSIKIWNNASPYNELASLQDEGEVYSILQLKNKDILVSSSTIAGISFWNLRSCQKEKTIPGYYSCNSGMIELPNGDIAVSSYFSDTPIVIIDTRTYTVVRKIVDSLISNSSSLCVFDNCLLFGYDGRLAQISLLDYAKMFLVKNKKNLGGSGGMIVVKNQSGNFVIVDNQEYGIEVIRPKYKMTK